MASSNGKDTIYIDIDDEITTIIEKVRGSDEKIVALVLPKRASVLQSVVNMKLLKRTADDAKKSLVLITSEAGLMPLAGSVGLYVAKNLQTKPEIPTVPGEEDAPEEISEVPLDDDDDEPVTAATAGNRPVGDLARGATTAAAGDEAIETLDLDDDDAGETPAETAAAKPKPAKNKKLRVPNFNTFRLRLLLGAVVLVLLIVFWILATSVLPRATVTLTTDTSDVNSNLNLNLSTTATSLDPGGPTLPATLKTIQKSQNQQVNTTGQQNNGQKATGTVTMTECVTNAGQLSSVPAGTGISTNGLTYITQQTATFGNYAGTGSGGCFKFQSTGIGITAQSAGSKYNTSLSGASVAGYPGVSADGSASGGTDDIIQVVAQADIDSAKAKIAAQDTSAIKGQLSNQLQQAGLYAITATFNAGTPNVTSSSNVGDQASTVTVTENTTYTMFGVKENDLKTLVDNDVKDQIDPSKQTILSEGLDQASFKVISSSATGAQVAMSTTATAGPDLKADAIKKQIAGMKSGEVITLLKNDPGVTDVKVNFSPFWVSSVPNKANKVTVIFQKAAK